MTIMLDTSVAISVRDADPAALDRVYRLQEPIILSAVTHVELEGGVEREAAEAARRRRALEKMLFAVSVVPFDSDAARAYGSIVARIGYARGKLLDRMIAAHAIHLGVALATANADDFRLIPGLDLEIWSG